MVETKASAPNRWAILFVLCAALMVVVVDVTVLHVAAPAQIPHVEAVSVLPTQ